MTTSRPARALRDAALLLTVVVIYRVPTIERAFVAALAAAADRVGPPQTAARPTDLIALAPVPTMKIAALPQAPLAAAGSPVRNDRAAAVAEVAVAPSPPFALPPATPLTVSLALAAPDTAASADAFATAAYARLAAGDRRAAVRLFDAALAGDDPRAPAWRQQRDALTRRWSGSAYSIVRAGGDPALVVTPVLGGGQSGGAIAYTPDPLSARPFAVTARGSIAHDDGGRSAFAAVGVQWHPFAGVTLAGERLIAISPAAPNDWTVRLAGGSDRTFGRWRATAYGEVGVVGRATYGAVQGRAAAVFHVAHVEIDPGAGLWSSVQRDRGATVDRVDVGPGVVARAGPFAAEVDYRVRVAGNAAPGSGPVLTLSTSF